jgi:hypothetical protein
LKEGVDMKKYFYSNELEKQGPFSFEELRNKDIKNKTLIWFQGLEDWKPAEEIKELGEILELIPPLIIKKDYETELDHNETYDMVEKVINIQRNNINYPKGFKLIRSLGIILGAYGVIGVIFIIMTKNLIITQALQESNQGVWASSFDLLCFLGLLFGAIFIFKPKYNGRIIILISVILSFIELIFNTITSDIIFPNVIIISIIANIVFYAILIEYFYNPKIKKFILETQYIKQGEIISINNISEIKIKNWITIKYFWRTFIIASIYSIMNPIIELGIFSFLAQVLSFIIACSLFAALVRVSRYVILKNKENFVKIIFFTSILLFIIMVFS